MTAGHLGRSVAALRRLAGPVDVPGTPLSLRLDTVSVDGDRARVAWSCADPEVLPGDRGPERRRVHGEVEVAAGAGSADEVARGWWTEVQLAAARRFRSLVDADWEPGVPPAPHAWTVDEAWSALLQHLGRYGAEVRVVDGEVRVATRGGTTTYRIDPGAWAAFLDAVNDQDEDSGGSADEDLAAASDPDLADASAIVPAAVPLADGLPLWAADELDEAAGAWGPVVGLVDGRLVGLPSDDA